MSWKAIHRIILVPPSDPGRFGVGECLILCVCMDSFAQRPAVAGVQGSFDNGVTAFRELRRLLGRPNGDGTTVPEVPRYKLDTFTAVGARDGVVEPRPRDSGRVVGGASRMASFPLAEDAELRLFVLGTERVIESML